jgi:uncharacterized membrane protein
VTWLNRYRLRDFVRSSFWIMPTCALFCALIAARVLLWVDEREHWVCLDYSIDGAKTILGAFVSSLLTFIVVIISSLLLIVQLVSASLTPRIIAPTFRHPIIRLCLSMFVFVYMLSIKLLARMTEPVPQLAVAVAIGLNLLSLILFLHFAGRVGMGLRPIEIMAAVAKKGRSVIYDIYPHAYDSSETREEGRAVNDLGSATNVVQHEGASGVLLAFDSVGLVALASLHKSLIELVPKVGDYVSAGEPLFRIYGSTSIQASDLRSMVALGPERTLEQDPLLAFRLILDIASKALSPAINDPTTAVLAIDQIHRLLRWVGGRKLLSGAQRDSGGSIRLIFPTPTWEDFVWLATTELRLYGSDSVRVCQRLRAMLEHLLHNLPEGRRPALELHLRLLNQAIDRKFPDPEDRNRVRTGASELTGASTDA